MQAMEMSARVLGVEHLANFVLTLRSQSRNKEAILLMKIGFQSSLEALNKWQMENIKIGLLYL